LPDRLPVSPSPRLPVGGVVAGRLRWRAGILDIHESFQREAKRGRCTEGQRYRTAGRLRLSVILSRGRFFLTCVRRDDVLRIVKRCVALSTRLFIMRSDDDDILSLNPVSCRLFNAVYAPPLDSPCKNGTEWFRSRRPEAGRIALSIGGNPVGKSVSQFG
jgi:hypothetical protein